MLYKYMYICLYIDTFAAHLPAHTRHLQMIVIFTRLGPKLQKPCMSCHRSLSTEQKQA